MRNGIIILFLSSAILAAGIYLAPDSKEMALMHMNDSHFKEAVQHYEAIHSQGDNSINVIAPLIKLHVNYGDIDAAIDLLETFILKNPLSFEAYQQLATLYKSSQRFYSYCRTLETLQKLSPSVNVLRELAETYNFLGRYKDEKNALARLVVSKGYYPQENDYIKLASFYRIDHQYAKATELVISFIDSKEYDVSINIMQLAMQLLLEGGQEQRAITIANKYIGESGNEEDAITLSMLFQKHGRIESAYNLLIPFHSNIEHSPDLQHQVVNLQLLRGKHEEIYRMLSAQFEKKIMPDNFSVILMDLAVKYKNYDLVKSVIQSTPLEYISENDLLRYAGLSLQLKDPDLAFSMQSRLGKEYLRDLPLLSALLEVAVNDTPEAVTALLALPPAIIIPPEQKIFIANIYLRHGYTRQAAALFDGMPVADMLEIMDPQQFARFYIDVSQPDAAVKLLKSAKDTSSPLLRDKIDKIFLLLAAGTGKAEVVEEWLAKHNNADNALLADAYGLVLHYKHNAAALVLARHIYNMHPTTENSSQLTEALLLNHKYEEALEAMKPLAEKDEKARAMYMEVMAGWIHNAGIKNIPDSNRKELGEIIKLALNDKHMPTDKKRNLAYLLKEAEITSEAEKIFLEIAGNQPFSSHDVSELLGFWGNDLSPAALSWIENRARNTSGIEKVQWLDYLNSARHPQIVVAVIDSIKFHGHVLPAPVIDEYISALQLTHNTAKLDSELTREIDKESNIVRLKKLAKIASEEALPEISEKGWRKVYDLHPDNAEAQKELGLLSFAVNHYTEAGKFLGEYLQHNQGDYRVNYVYGEILQRQAKKEQAKQYFEKAQKQLSEIKFKTIEDSLEEARLFYRNNKLEESLALYRKLLSQFPTNKTLRADFAEILIENRQFEEAERVLEQ